MERPPHHRQRNKRHTNNVSQRHQQNKKIQDILRKQPAPPPTHLVNNAYEIRAQPQLIRYYHAAAGFPTKPQWIKAIKNGHYSSWPHLTAAAVRRSFPESVETWKGHGQKNQMNLRSTKALIEEEGNSMKELDLTDDIA